MRTSFLPLLLGLAASSSSAMDPAPVQRTEIGNRISENIPAIPATLLEQLNRYQNTRGASFAGWTKDGCLLIETRFAETAQAHRVCQPLGMREQITFYPEPLGALAAAPAQSGLDGFVFGKDIGGNEFSQLYWFDFGTRGVSLLTDGKRSQNGQPLFSRDGKQLAFSSTARNGTDTDVWLMDFSTRKAQPLVSAGGEWSAQDFSPDGRRLLVLKYVSANESYPGEVDLKTGKLTLFPVDGGKATFGTFQYAGDGRSVYYVSDEDVTAVGGKKAISEFTTLRFHAPGKSAAQRLSTEIPWNIDALRMADDGKHLAFSSNEDGIGKLHALHVPDHTPVSLPDLPLGVVGAFGFSPNGQQLAVTLNTATSPSDVYVIDLKDAHLVRWTKSEVGGLDAGKFIAPTLVRYPTFDQVSGKARTIPAFYYRPAGSAVDKKLPVVISIHGGPESQALPSFNPMVQFLANELGVAVLVPNVRGSNGYGKSFLRLDNAEKREDSVKDIGALLDWIAQQPELDAKRVGVTGGSYGGYMVLATLTHYSDRLRAGVEIVGISNFKTFLTNTESYRRDLRRAEYGDERNASMAAVFDRISPLNHAADIKVPLFVAQGRNDPRVPWTEAEQIVKAVRSNGQPVWYLLYADEGHGFKKKSNNDFFGAASVLFWQQHLLGNLP
ncbi:MAG: S9 family peptidase [Tahibacter sp.]